MSFTSVTIKSSSSTTFEMFPKIASINKMYTASIIIFNLFFQLLSVKSIELCLVNKKVKENVNERENSRN